MLRPLSDTLSGVILGALLTGAFLILAQLLAARSQTVAVREAARVQADAAREAWDRSHKAQRHAELESMCVEILRYINQIEDTVVTWKAGGMTGPEAVAAINTSARAVMESGFSIVLRQGPADQTAILIGQVLDQTRKFSQLYKPGQEPPATEEQKTAQVGAVKSAEQALRAYVHQMLKDDEAQGITT
jgi:hypothetical protein